MSDDNEDEGSVDAGPEEFYVMDVQVNRAETVAGATWSDMCIRLYDVARGLSGASTVELAGHQDRITGFTFADAADTSVVSCGEDGLVAVWDTRAQGVAQRFSAADAEGAPTPFTSLDVGCGGNLIAVGTDEEEDSQVIFWDRRSAKKLATYSESHVDVVTQVRFHPTRTTELATASMDGLVCYFDIAKQTEELALESVVNAEGPVSKIGFFGPNLECLYVVAHLLILRHVTLTDQTNEYRYCLTHSETLSLFHAQKALVMAEFGNMRTLLADQGTPADFLVDCCYVQGPPSAPDSQTLLLVSGNHEGHVSISDVTLAGVRPLCTLAQPTAHSADVRSVAFLRRDVRTGVPSLMFSGGEDGQLCEWAHRSAPAAAAKAKAGPNRGKSARARSRRGRRRA